MTPVTLMGVWSCRVAGVLGSVRWPAEGGVGSLRSTGGLDEVEEEG